MLNLSFITLDTSVVKTLTTLAANATKASYQWIDCDNGNSPIEGEIFKTYTSGREGNYAVIITDNNCIDTSSCFTIDFTGLVLNSFKNNITLFPNPTEGHSTIYLDKIYSNVVVIVSSIDGRIIQKENISDAQKINLKLINSSGVYLVSITSGNEKAVFKLVKY
jgi:hypothetical protein